MEKEIEQLKKQLTGDMFKDMEVKEQIHELEMKLKGVKPLDGSCEIGCDSCGA
tara:strand:- start:1614 stop:1772 length:159 start_codon:yes stop_codon:yes gene_type:complete